MVSVGQVDHNAFDLQLKSRLGIEPRAQWMIAVQLQVDISKRVMLKFLCADCYR